MDITKNRYEINVRIRPMGLEATTLKNADRYKKSQSSYNIALSQESSSRSDEHASKIRRTDLNRIWLDIDL